MPKSRSGVWIHFDGKLVLEPREFKPKGLAARPGADLHHPVLRHNDLLDAREPMSVLRSRIPSCSKFVIQR
jgi:hypothetical protein